MVCSEIATECLTRVVGKHRLGNSEMKCDVMSGSKPALPSLTLYYDTSDNGCWYV